MTRIWRCVPRAYLDQAYAGLGGCYVDGRWHTAGRPIVYASLSPGTAVLEAVVHVGRLEPILSNFALVGAEIPSKSIELAEDLPADWNALPFSATTQALGDRWLSEAASLALRVPSAVLPDDNVLLNPAHADVAALKVNEAPIAWTPRLEALTPLS